MTTLVLSTKQIAYDYFLVFANFSHCAAWNWIVEGSASKNWSISNRSDKDICCLFGWPSAIAYISS
jgi:hypothetical protein